MGKNIIKILILVIASSLLSCKDYSYVGQPHLILTIADSSSHKYTSLLSSVNSVEIYDGVKWQMLSCNPSQFDLMELTGGDNLTLADEDVSQGKYSRIRVCFGGENNYITIYGEKQTRELLSDSISLIWETEISYEAVQNDVSVMEIDVDLNKAVEHDTITDNYSFVPYKGCRLIDAEQCGVVSAVMYGEDEKVLTSVVQVKIISQDSLLYTTHSNSESGRVFVRLPNDIYDIKFCPLDSSYSSQQIEDVIIENGNYLSLGKIEFEKL